MVVYKNKANDRIEIFNTVTNKLINTLYSNDYKVVQLFYFEEAKVLLFT